MEGDARRVAIVTGSSSGIGLAASLALARAGHTVHATMRDTSRSGRLDDAASAEGLDVRVSQMDVDDDSSVEAAVSRALGGAGRLDVLVNNAGYGAVGAVEDIPMGEFRAQFETNLFGVVRVIKAAAPAMRRTAAEGAAAGGGPGPTIVNVSSVAGRIGFPATSAYISSKFALEGLSESLAYELAPFGVRVVVVEPGVIKTNFFDSMRMCEAPAGSPYADMTAKVVSNVRMMVELGTEASEVADAIARAASSDKPLPRYVVGNDAVMFLEARKSKTDAEFVEYMSKELFSR